MTSYTYVANDTLGTKHEGEVSADSQEEAVQTLKRDGFQIVKIEERKKSGGLIPRGISKKEIIYITAQLSIMVDTGISLAAAMDGIHAQCDNPTLKRVLGEIKGRVEGGEDFSRALGFYPKYFDKSFIALIKASEQTGQLAEMLDTISGYMRAEMETKAKVVGALAYPGIMATIAFGITIFLLTYIMPKFIPVFRSKGIDLPWTTDVLIFLSGSLLNYWYLWILGVAIFVTSTYFWVRSATGRRVKDYVFIHIPIIGPVVRKVIISRCLRTLGAMVQSGVSMLDAIQLTAEVSGNHYYEIVWLEVIGSISQGNRICDTLFASPLFPKTVVQMISSGEEAGKLDYVLNKVSGFYDKEVEASLKTVTSMIEPLVILVMGGVVGTIGFSIMLPIFKLSTHR
ncbi:MAG: type IV pilus assembly protein PilC [Pirellulaceae bacterium]|jgi:type IV pilus assembly protein PilC